MDFHLAGPFSGQVLEKPGCPSHYLSQRHPLSGDLQIGLSQDFTDLLDMDLSGGLLAQSEEVLPRPGFLSFRWLTALGRVSRETPRLLTILKLANTTWESPSLCCHDLLFYLGHLLSACLAVPLLRLHIRHLQMDLNRVY